MVFTVLFLSDTINAKKNDRLEGNAIKQISSGRNDNFAYNNHGLKQQVKLSSVDMSVFGDLELHREMNR